MQMQIGRHDYSVPAFHQQGMLHHLSSRDQQLDWILSIGRSLRPGGFIAHANTASALALAGPFTGGGASSPERLFSTAYFQLLAALKN